MPVGSGRVSGKVVVVTGAGRGQGAAVARLLATEGASVIAVDLTDEPTETLPAEVRYRRLDVTDVHGWNLLASDLRRDHGRVDGVVANAGITWRARLADVEQTDVDRVHQVNVIGTLLSVQSLTPLMPPGGSIVVVGSAAALTGHFPIAYTASKWALRGLAKAACLDLGPKGIRVNTVHPGYIRTPMTADTPSSFRAATIAETSLGRVGAAHEVAPLIVFLISDDSSFISGAEIPVDGGLTAHGGMKSISAAFHDADGPTLHG